MDDEDWDAAIARARLRAAALGRPQQPHRGMLPPEMQVTPPPLVGSDRSRPPAARQKGLWSGAPVQLKARLDALVTGGAGVKRSDALRAALAACRPAELDMVTPPPVARPAPPPLHGDRGSAVRRAHRT